MHQLLRRSPFNRITKPEHVRWGKVSPLSGFNVVAWADNNSVLEAAHLLPDLKTGTLSMWVRFDAAAVVADQGSFLVFQNAAGGTRRLRFDRTTPNANARSIGQNSASSNIVDVQSSPINLFPNGAIVHLALAFDLAATTVQLYVDGISQAGANTPIDDFINYTASPIVSIARRVLAAGAANAFAGRMTEVWFAAAFVNLDGGGIDAFIDGGRPADLGANGENPLGGKPLIYFGRDMKANSGGDLANGTGPGWNGGANLGSLGGWVMSGPGVVDV